MPVNSHSGLIDVPLLCRECPGRVAGICSVLSPAELVGLATQSHKTRHAAGRRLIGEGAVVSSYASLRHGVVKLSKVTETGCQQVVGLQFAPDFVGRLFGDESALTAEAATDVELCVVPRRAFELMVDITPALERRLMQQTLRELDQARNWMVTLGRKSAHQKVASLLWLLASHAQTGSGKSRDLHFDLPLTRADIGDFLGLTFETVSRQMTLMRMDGVIQTIGSRHVKVPDPGMLHQRCG